MIVKRIFSFFGALLFLLVSACTTGKVAIGQKKGVLAKHAMVVSAKREASEIGLAILKKGGNAFDAMEKKALWTIEKKPLVRHIVICIWMPKVR